MIEIFTDGSTPVKNPSPVGITWAFAVVSEGNLQYCESGFISTADCKGYKASNNLAEMIAAIKGIEYVNKTYGVIKQDVPITFNPDSELTLNRLFKGYSMKKLPPNVHQRALALNLHNITPVLHAGHPTKKELAAGFKIKGSRKFPVSSWNVLCDNMCEEEAKFYIEKWKNQSQS